MNHPQVVAALIVGGLGFLFVLIGMVSTGWMSDDNNLHAGLFVVCLPTCASYSAEGSVAATKAFVVISFLCCLAGVIDCLIYYLKHARKDTTHKILALVTAVLFIVAAITALLGAITFGAAGKSETEIALRRSLTLGYSFGLTIVGGICCGVAGALALVHRLGL